MTKSNLNLNNKSPVKDYSFSKEERLCSLKNISFLLEKGASIFVAPLKFIYIRVPSDININYPVQVLIVAPRRIYKTSVERNAVKRLLRECYRLNKPHLYDALNARECRLFLAIIYNKPDKLPLDNICESYLAGISKLLNKLDQPMT